MTFKFFLHNQIKNLNCNLYSLTLMYHLLTVNWTKTSSCFPQTASQCDVKDPLQTCFQMYKNNLLWRIFCVSFGFFHIKKFNYLIKKGIYSFSLIEKPESMKMQIIWSWCLLLHCRVHFTSHCQQMKVKTDSAQWLEETFKFV